LSRWYAVLASQMWLTDAILLRESSQRVTRYFVWRRQWQWDRSSESRSPGAFAEGV